MKLKISRYPLPVFSSHDVETRLRLPKLRPGHVFEVLETWREGEDWWAKVVHEGREVWFVTESGGQIYAAAPGEAPVSPDEKGARWRRALVEERNSSGWVSGMVVQAMSKLSTDAQPVQRRAALNMISLIGIQERPARSNRGPALSGIVGEYVEHYRIAADKESKGLAWCALAAQWAQAEAMGISWATPAAWHEHPLGDWIGAVWMQEREAKARGLWRSCGSLEYGEILTGGLLIQTRSGSGSDAGSAGIRRDGSYNGHVDIVLGWKDEHTLWCVGGNLGDTAKLVERDIRKVRCRGFVPFEVTG